MNTTATPPKAPTTRVTSMSGMSGDPRVEKVRASLADVSGITAPTVKLDPAAPANNEAASSRPAAGAARTVPAQSV